jgi:MoaA/NifB/PqqE/SkfB family radical SAM enzyme
MTEDTARRSIDWLHETGCRAVALMGGEVLLRPQFAHKVVYYAARRGFSVQVTTHGRRLRREVIDQLRDAGVAAVELSVSSDGDCQKLSQALRQDQPAIAHPLRQQHLYGSAVCIEI